MLKSWFTCLLLCFLLPMTAWATVYLNEETIGYESFDLDNTPVADVYYVSMDIYVGSTPAWGGLSLYTDTGAGGSEMFLIGFDSSGEFGVKNKANGDPWTDVLDFEGGQTYHLILEVAQSAQTIKLWVTNLFYDQPDYSGEPVGGVSSTGTEFQEPLSVISFEGQWGSTAEYYNVIISDDISDHFIVPPPEIASDPNPADDTNDIAVDMILDWAPGIYEGTHQIYLGTDAEDVNSSTTPLAEVDANNYIPAADLDLGQTYFWRVDEVNASSDKTVYKGNVWSFETEPVAFLVYNVTAEASSSNGTTSPTNLVNGSGLDEEDRHSTNVDDMWVSAYATGVPQWIVFEFQQTVKLDEMLIWNANQISEKYWGRDVAEAKIEISIDGENWTTLYEALPLETGTYNSSYYVNNIIDMAGNIAQYVRLTCLSNRLGLLDAYCLSEVRFMHIPSQARRPSPANGSQTQRLNAQLQWRSGRDAIEHDVYLSTDANLVEAGDASVWVGTFSETQLDLAGLVDYQQTYYWKVNERYDDINTPVWEGQVWSFSTPDSQVIDNMESYNDIDPQVFIVWPDGYDIDENGSQVGYTNPTYMERELVHGGKQAMPFSYSSKKGATVSTATRSFSPSQDWTAGGIQSLVLYFMGDPENDEGQLYIKINETRVDYPTPAHLTRRAWAAWQIDLTGLDVGDVSSMTLGVDNYGSGKGLLMIDDIELFRVAPEESNPVVPADPGTDNLIALYHLDGNMQDSSGSGYHGTDVNSVSWDTGLFGQALELSGNDCVDLGQQDAWNPTGSLSVSLWAKINNWTEDWGCVMISNRGEGAYGWQIRRYSTTDKLCFTTRGIGTDDLPSRITIVEDEWIHIVGVFDAEANQKRLYVNGSLDINAATTMTIGASTHNACIGARASEDNTYQESFFDGWIDEVRIYDDALTADEVGFLANQ